MKIKERPKPKSGDAFHTLVKAGLSAIPLVGGPAAEFFTTLITPPIIRRRDEWVESLAGVILALKEKIADLNFENLKNNDQFVPAVLRATTSASRTHNKEKLEALKNAILNIALKIEPDEDLHLIFLNYIDELTRWHLRLLSFFSSPVIYYKKSHGKDPDRNYIPAIEAIEYIFPELKGNRPFCDQIIKDLDSRGLISAKIPGSLFRYGGTFVSDLGQRFLSFISSPIENNEAGWPPGQKRQTVGQRDLGIEQRTDEKNILEKGGLNEKDDSFRHLSCPC